MQIYSSISIDNLHSTGRKVQTETVRIEDIDFTNPVDISKAKNWLTKAHAAALAVQACSISNH